MYIIKKLRRRGLMIAAAVDKINPAEGMKFYEQQPGWEPSRQRRGGRDFSRRRYRKCNIYWEKEPDIIVKLSKVSNRT